jgi:multimeric flavodoxin WrbA
MPKNILILMCSPRNNGSTNALCNAFFEGASEKGHHITKICASDVKINPCIDCNYCLSHGGACVEKDGMTEIYSAFEHADVVVLASPLYFYSINAQLKTIIDRLYAPGNFSGFKFTPKESVLIMTCGEKTSDIFDQPKAYYNTLLKKMFPWEHKGEILVSGLSGKIGCIEGNPSLEEAKQLGLSL